MKTPVCIISFNRALYLDSLLHSLTGELESIDIIVVDNGSTEKKIQDVFSRWQDKVQIVSLKGGDWINDEYKAKNYFINLCHERGFSSESYLFLQDDMQYVGPQGHLGHIIENLNSTKFLNISMTGVRRSTINSTYSANKVGNVWQLKDNHFGTIGLHRREVFEKVGQYVENYPTEKSYWGRGEDDYHSRVILKYGQNFPIAGFSHVPSFISVWNDPRGHYSFLRNNMRYGQYLPPTGSNKLYYDHLPLSEYEKLITRKYPSGFVDVAFPIGWSYAKNPEGDQEKYSQQKIMIEGPVREIT